MLVLSRKVGQGILIGDDIRLVVVRMGNGKVRIGIEAPGEVKILRFEVAQAQNAEEFELDSSAELDQPAARMAS